MNRLEIFTKKFKTRSYSIFLIWLFPLSAIIGISLGHYDWFISKTPLNLLIVLVLLIINFPINTTSKTAATVIFIVSSLLVEWVGVQFGFLFGAYEYGQNLGIKVDGVPLLIGVNWAVLILVTGAIADKFVKPTFLKILLGASLMLSIDFFIEKSAPPFDFWVFELGHAPIRNYVGWFVVSLVLHYVYRLLHTKGDFTFSCHLYAAQLLFFIYFYGYHSL
jgi:uncharacterized membrane protein